MNGRAWKFEIQSTFIAYVTDFTNLPKITSCVKIDDQMFVNVYQGGYLVPPSELNWLLGNGIKLTRWSQFENLLKRVELSSSDKPSKIFLQEATLSCFEQLLPCYEEDVETSTTRSFLKELLEG